jgi:hypothetical protein
MKLNINFIYVLLLFIFPPCKLLAFSIEERPVLVYNACSSGMFANFACVLGVLQIYEQYNCSGVKIDFSNGCYLDPAHGPNWWEYFFEPINIVEQNAPTYIFSSLDDIHSICVIGFSLSRQRAFELIQRYIHVKPNIQAEVDTFIQKYFENHFIIGVHHRGTDKILEIPLISYQTTIQILNTVTNNLSPEQRNKLKIYVATDDQEFMKYMIAFYSPALLYNNFVRSADATPLHYGNDNRYSSNYQKGKEALMDCLLLSKCNFLIRPMSSLSTIADRFNPNLPVIILMPSS